MKRKLKNSEERKDKKKKNREANESTIWRQLREMLIIRLILLPGAKRCHDPRHETKKCRSSLCAHISVV